MRFGHKVNLVVIGCIAMILISCRNQAQNEGYKIFRYNESKSIASLDPAFARNQASIWPINQIYNGLVQMNDSLQILPCIAKSWSVSDNGLDYTFTLRNDIYFHDHFLFKSGKGRRVVASDFVYSFNRLIDSKIASPGSWIFNNVDKEKSNTDYGFKALNDSVLIISLTTPFPAFLGLLTMQYCSVVPFEVVEYYKKDFRNHPVGTGPFIFKLWVEGEKLVLLKNKNYFETDDVGVKLPKIDAVSITFIPDKQSEFLEFMKGKIDFISGVNAAFKDEFISRDGKLQAKYAHRFKMLTCPYLNTEYIGINADTTLDLIKNNPLKHKSVRLAMNMAIDRKKMISYLRNNIGYPANSGFVPRGMPSFSDSLVKGYAYNPDSARKLLVNAGYPNGKGLPVFKITTVSDYLDICEFLQNELEQIGIQIEIEVVTGLAYREMLANSRMQLFRASWIADYADAENYLALFYGANFCPQGPNYTHFSNKQFDKLYLLAMQETNNEKRYTYYQEMDRIVLNEAVVIPLFYDVALRFTQNNIVGLGINPLNLLVLKNVEVNGEQ
jgi:oligopeptide transport system substrate-binding protein